jgi:hypothetical protein
MASEGTTNVADDRQVREQIKKKDFEHIARMKK